MLKTIVFGILFSAMLSAVMLLLFIDSGRFRLSDEPRVVHAQAAQVMAPLTACIQNGVPATVPIRGVGGVPAFDALINGSTTCLLGLHLNNTTGVNLTVTIHDGGNQFSRTIPLTSLGTPGDHFDLESKNGIEFDNSLSWSASGVGVIGGYFAMFNIP